MNCPLCTGDLLVLGQLGDLVHTRCRCCGTDLTGPVEEQRHVRLDTGHGLRVWLIERQPDGRCYVGYRFTAPDGYVLFEGEDFGSSPLVDWNSEEAICALIGFLTLRPGDTDAEWFASYSERQLEFAESADCERLQWLYSENGPGAFEEVLS